jgi:hypothetical protein
MQISGWNKFNPQSGRPAPKCGGVLQNLWRYSLKPVANVNFSSKTPHCLLIASSLGPRNPRSHRGGTQVELRLKRGYIKVKPSYLIQTCLKPATLNFTIYLLKCSVNAAIYFCIQISGFKFSNFKSPLSRSRRGFARI